MHAAYVVITALLIFSLGYAVWADLSCPDWLVTNMNRVNVPRTWLPLLAALKAAAAAGLIAGFWIPFAGLASAAAAVVYFMGALVTHLRARYYAVAFASAYLILAVASFALAVRPLR
jgi:hypothetical protein